MGLGKEGIFKVKGQVRGQEKMEGMELVQQLCTGDRFH